MSFSLADGFTASSKLIYLFYQPTAIDELEMRTDWHVPCQWQHRCLALVWYHGLLL